MPEQDVVGIKVRLDHLNLAAANDYGSPAIRRPVVLEVTPGEGGQTPPTYVRSAPVILRLVLGKATIGEVDGTVGLNVEGTTVAFKVDTCK